MSTKCIGVFRNSTAFWKDVWEISSSKIPLSTKIVMPLVVSKLPTCTHFSELLNDV